MHRSRWAEPAPFGAPEQLAEPSDPGVRGASQTKSTDLGSEMPSSGAESQLAQSGTPLSCLEPGGPPQRRAAHALRAGAVYGTAARDRSSPGLRAAFTLQRRQAGAPCARLRGGPIGPLPAAKPFPSQPYSTVKNVHVAQADGGWWASRYVFISQAAWPPGRGVRLQASTSCMETRLSCWCLSRGQHGY